MHEGQLLAGKYRIERVLGEGGMGRVVAAVHEQLHQRVAIKFLLPEAMAMPEAVERFLREARASVKLRSEHVGRVIDVGTLEDGAPYMVMEYLEGTDLDGELVRRRALPPVEAIDYVLQACEAIAEAHSHGLVHRDIKPANLFLTRKADGSPLVKVLDFGIAKAAPTDPSYNMTRTRAVMGSPGYMSPEQLRSSRRVDSRSDIWSLGVVLYQLLSGRQPFSGETFSDLCINVATEPPAPLAVPGLATDLMAAVMRCLEKDPAHRYQNVAELAAALEPFAHTGRGAGARIARVLQVPTAAPSAPSGAIPRHAQPTTLSSAASEQHHPMTAAPSRRRLWLAGGVLVTVAVVAGAIVAVTGGTTPTVASATPDAALDDALTPTATSPDAAPGNQAATIADAAPVPDAAPIKSAHLTRIFGREKPKVTACFEEHALEVKGTPRIWVRLEVAAEGKVTNAELDPLSMSSSKLGACLLSVARDIHFGRLERAVAFRVPIQARAKSRAAEPKRTKRRDRARSDEAEPRKKKRDSGLDLDTRQ